MTERPTGTVTFLFTDIEGSTDLWERYPDAMPDALERHDAMVRQSIEANQGHVFKTVGDAFHGVFSDAARALEAAVGAQRGLRSERWPMGRPLEVRMALHSGTAEERGGDYFGPPVNRVARILAAGHGGQILLSQAVERLASDRFPVGVALRDLGERQLKDLARPERLFQIVTEDLPVDFPPLGTLDARPHNLPAQPSPLIGRTAEVGEARRLLLRENTRLVTLTGPSGTGKTRLGLQVAAEVVDAFRDGVFMVDLASVREPERVPQAILAALGVQLEGESDPDAALEGYLRDRELLLVLDNFEQVLEAAECVSRLLRAAAGLTVLVTSQAPLHLRGEYEYPIPPLAVPDPGDRPTIERLADYEAVTLFTERAQAVQPSFRLSEDNAEAVVEIVRQLDGLPLAIELAAARLKLFPPRAMVGRLSRRFDFLKSGSRDLPDRQRTLRGAIDWSYNLLDADERAVLRRLSTFDGGFTLESAETVVVDDDESIDVIDAIASLVDKSLLRAVESAGDEPRFERLRTIRDFSVEMLETCDDAERWRRRHADHFAALAERMVPSASSKPDTARMLDRLDSESENVRTALAWALDRGEGELAVRLSAALPALWLRRGNFSEAGRVLERLEELAEEMDDLNRAHVLNLSGRYAQIMGDNSPETVARFEKSLALYREAGHRSGVARALMNLGNVRSRRDDHEEARKLFEEARAIYAEQGDAFGIGGALLNLGDSHLAEADLDLAETHFRRARDIARESGNRVMGAFALQYLGILATRRGQLDRAHAAFSESETEFQALGARPGIAWSRFYTGTVAWHRGEFDSARGQFTEALERFRDLGVRPGIACALIGLAALAAEEGRSEDAARLLGAADAIFEVTSMTRSTLERSTRDRVMTVCLENLGEDACDRLRADGRDLPLERALALARKSRPTGSPAS